MSKFATQIITWQKVHGRHSLPWQNTRDPYAIWVSEIMLQQTQVTAVIGYYAKFMARFPTILQLANATQDEVLQHWSGLGYYSRARNLHNSAQIIVDEHYGKFPQDFTAIQALPGIGRSTAAAISSFAFGKAEPIMDGNVKRVFARHFLVEGWTSQPKVEKHLWALADDLMPATDMIAYTQGLMDLGATLCSRSKPKCMLCPLVDTCGAYATSRVKELPTPKPRKTIPEKQTTMLILRRGDEVMLVKRPSTGIWGGLWSLPEVSDDEDFAQVCQRRFGTETSQAKRLKTLSHAFTHFKLHINPQPMHVLSTNNQVSEPSGTIWLAIDDAVGAAIPTPIRKILLSLKNGSA